MSSFAKVSRNAAMSPTARLAAAVVLLLVSALAATTVLSRATDTVDVSPGADLQRILDEADDGAVIRLAAGATFVGTYTLPAGKTGTLTTAGPLIAEGVRVGPGDRARLATLRSPDNRPALRVAPGARGWTVDGVAVTCTDPRCTAIAVGAGDETSLEHLPSDIALRHVLVLGDPVKGMKRGVGFHVVRGTIADSHIGDVFADGQDTQAVWVNVGSGIAIRNSYLAASGENVLTGGDDTRIEGHSPSDIVVEQNTIEHPLTWKEMPYDVKNLLELKNAKRVTVRGNIFRGNWPAAQAGYAIVITPKDQYGRAPWATVEDLLFERNVIRDVSSGINVTGIDSTNRTERSTRLTFRGNLILASQAAYGGDGRCMQIGRGPQQIEFIGNTCIADGSSWIYTYAGGPVTETRQAVFRDNVAFHNKYGFFGAGKGVGSAALAFFYPGAVFTNNVLAGGRAASYPPGNHLPDTERFRDGFVDFENGNYRLRDGVAWKGAGADIGRLP